MGQRTTQNYLQIIQVGNSKGIIIPLEMLNAIGAEGRDYVFVTLEKLTKSELTERLIKLKKEGV